MLFDLLTRPLVLKGKKPCRDQALEFVARMTTLYDATPSSGKRQVTARRDLLASAAQLYAALNDVPEEEVAAWVGIPKSRMFQMRRYAGLPGRKSEMADVWHAAMLAATMNAHQATAFEGLATLSRTIEKAGRVIEGLLDDISVTENVGERVARLGKVTEAMEALSRLSAPVAFLYRDSLDTSLDTKITKWLSKPWSKLLVSQIMALCQGGPTPGQTRRGRAGGSRG